MEYHEAADFLFDLGRFRLKPGTASTDALLDRLDDPHEGVDFVQVAGSNGKGSTARMVERVLREAGLSVGLYTSPHLDDLRERIRVDGRKIPKREVAAFVAETREYVTDRGADGESPTFFEAMTALGLWHFAREDVDVAVLEVGIGGKFDATSVVDPVASAVTSVTLEHTGIIGDTIEEIARDKAHVAGERPLVTGAAGEALEAVRSVAGDVITVGRVGDADRDRSPDVAVEYGGRTNHAEAAVSIDGGDWTVETKLATVGAHQAENAGIAATLVRQVAEALAVDVATTDLERGLRKAHWPGRFEVVETEPLVVLDGAHNPGACERLAETLSTFEYDALHLVVGAMGDKDHRAMAAALPTPETVVACKPTLDRAEEPAVLAEVFERAADESGSGSTRESESDSSRESDAGGATVRTEPAVQDAFASALAAAGPDDCVLATGSLFVVAEARARYTHAAVPRHVRDLDDATDILDGAGVPPEAVHRVRESTLHRVVTMRLQYRQAIDLQRELLRVGGECSLSGLQRSDELVEVVCAGTVAQFERLLGTLSARSDGLSEVVRQLREASGIEAGSGVGANASDVGRSPPRYPWEEQTAVMGILNVTPDSFHDGGEYDDLAAAVSRAEAMIEAGADVIDVGGESTRPGADPVPVEDEIDRVVPVIERLADRDTDALLSVDTRKAAVAEAALEAGADVLNDVSGLEDPEMRFVAAEYDVPIVLMHSIDAPVVPGRDVAYDDVVEDVIEELTETVLLAEKAGLDREQIVVDPGIGFGKSARESFELLERIGEFRALGCPVLVGHSHKSMFDLVDCGPDARGDATVAASALAADRGADIVRVHDVPENVAAVKTALAARNPAEFADDG